jgi:hypothetical protein
MKHLLARTCVFSLASAASLLAVAQALPRFGRAKFGQAVSVRLLLARMRSLFP